MILAQVYHPNTEAVIREGRALFAGDDVPLDERMVSTDRVLEDAFGERWVVQVPMFTDPRLAALLAHRREAELVQAALRGRPLDHSEAQITLLFGLPLESLPPTEVQEGRVSAQSNVGCQEQVRGMIAAAIERFLAEGKRVISVDDLAGATAICEVTVRRGDVTAYTARLDLQPRASTSPLSDGWVYSSSRIVSRRVVGWYIFILH